MVENSALGLDAPSICQAKSAKPNHLGTTATRVVHAPHHEHKATRPQLRRMYIRVYGLSKRIAARWIDCAESTDQMVAIILEWGGTACTRTYYLYMAPMRSNL